MTAQPAWVNSVHPASWWLIGLAGGVAATLASTGWFSGLLCALSVVMVAVLRDRTRQQKSLRFYLTMSAFVIALRLAFRFVFGDQPVGLADLGVALGDGLKIAAIILCVAVANTLADPRKLLRSTPPALYQVATAIAIALNFAPQLIASLARVRRAARLRGRSKGLGAFKSIIVPTLTDALERSLQLAASMDARGFGEQSPRSRVSRRLSLGLAGVALASAATASFLLLTTNESLAATATAAAGVGALVAYLRVSGRGSIRTRLVQQNLGAGDAALWVICYGVIALGWWLGIGSVTV